MLQLELTLQQLTERVSANIANIDSDLIRTGRLTKNHQTEISQAWEDFDQELKGVRSRLTFFAPSAATVQDCEFVLKSYGFKVWFIDYVSLVKHASKVEGWEKLSETVKAFKRLAKRYNIAVVIACQVNTDKETGEIDIRYAKAMKEDADVVLVWNLTKETRDEGVCWVRHLKARQYEMFDFPVRIALNHCRFESFEPMDLPTTTVRSLKGKRKKGPVPSTPKPDEPFQKKTMPLPVPERRGGEDDRELHSPRNPVQPARRVALVDESSKYEEYD